MENFLEVRNNNTWEPAGIGVYENLEDARRSARRLSEYWPKHIFRVTSSTGKTKKKFDSFWKCGKEYYG